MNCLKSLFISGFVTYLTSLTVYAASGLIQQRPIAMAWLGLLLCAATLAGFFAGLFIFKPARTERHPVGISVTAGLGLCITMVAVYRYPGVITGQHFLAASAMLGWLIYLRWYSVFPTRHSSLIEPGRQLPEFDLQESDGQLISSTSLVGRYHILVFYRGNWCPLCTAQIKELAAHYQTLQTLGADVLLISPQPAAYSQKLARRFAVPMRFFHDAGNRAARALGIASRWSLPMGFQLLGYNSDTVLPTVLITNPDGTIIFADQTDNYRLRPEPETFIKLLQEQAAS